MNELLKIPTNFHELSNVNVLFDTVEFLDQVKEQINNYSEAFIDTFLMSRSEVEQYIPECDHDKYKFQFHKKPCLNPHASLHEKLMALNETDSKVFIVDTKKKIINFAWLEGTDTSHLIFIPVHENDRRTSVKFQFQYYDRKHDIQYDKTKKKIVLINDAHYSRKDIWQGDGPWISTSGGNGYWMGGGSRTEYYKTQMIHTFCIQTNQYLGCSLKTESLNDYQRQR